MKRITSIILSIVMLISTTSSIVFANDEINVFNEPQDGYEVTLEENAALLEPSSENSISLFSAESVTNSKKDDITRYTVLALDTSGSMYGKPMTAAKSAAIKFCEDILKADGHNYVALITLNSSSTKICDFTDDISTVSNKINSLSASGGTNTNDSLVKANTMLGEITLSNNVVKNIVLLSDGLPESGAYSYDGVYTSSDYYDYEYANTAYATAQTLKSNYFIYSLGFFHALSGSQLAFGRKFMSDLQNAGYYDVTNVDDLEFQFGNIADDITNIAKAGTFRYASGEEKNFEGIYYYDDNYFSSSSTEYNHSLSTMSLCLALSAFASNNGGNSDYSNKYENVKYLLVDELGFDKFAKNDWFTKKPTSESIGVVAANKKIKDNNDEYTLIAVAVRGGGYESEWASNFTIGTSGQASGFDNAKSQVLEFIKDYIADSENEISGKIKLWITGYSRAAATTNLVAGEIDKGFSLGNNITLDNSDLFAYCFETPMGALKSDNVHSAKYKNIWNIINKNDPVTKVAMSDLGFDRYGTDHYLPDTLTDSYFVKHLPIMLGYYNQMDSYSVTGAYKVDDFQMKKLALGFSWNDGVSLVQDDLKNDWSQGAFLDTTLSKIVKETIHTRQYYVSELQNGVRIVFTAMYGTLFEGYTKENINEFFELFLDKISNPSTLGSLCWNAIVSGDASVTDMIEDLVADCLNECHMNNLSVTDFEDFIVAIVKILVQFAVSHPNLTTTLVSNIDTMGAAHYPELCMAWLMTEDKNYTKDPVEFNGTGSYRIIRINCPVDVNVYDSNNTLVASIKNDTPIDVDDSHLVSALNEDGEKVVFLPIDEDYSLQLSATANGTVNYNVSEYCSNTGEYNRLINYYNINVQESDVLTGIVPSYTDDEINNGTNNGSTAKYALLDTNNTEIEANQDLLGDEAANAFYMVNVTSENENYGIVSGQGIRQSGNFALVEASANEGYKFIGWYKDNTLISEESSYRFCVTEETDLVAKFVPISSVSHSSGGSRTSRYTIKFETDGGTEIKNTTIKRNGILAEPETPTKEGFKFDGWFVNKELTTKYDFSQKVTSSFTLYAAWSRTDVESAQIILTIGSKSAKVFGEIKENDVAPIIRNNRTLLPARFIAENLGATVEWNEAEQKVIIRKDDIEIVLFIDSDTAYVNNEMIKLDSPAFIENDRTYTPVRFIAENLGAIVDWEEGNKSVIITKK